MFHVKGKTFPEEEALEDENYRMGWSASKNQTLENKNESSKKKACVMYLNRKHSSLAAWSEPLGVYSKGIDVTFWSHSLGLLLQVVNCTEEIRLECCGLYLRDIIY